MSKPANSFLICAVSLVAIVMLALAAGCTGSENTKTATPGTADTPASAGQRETISVSGSTTVLPIVQKAADSYMAAHTNADIQVAGGGSGVGIQAIGKKTVNIGMSSRELKASEMEASPNLAVTTIAQDGIAIVVNPKNGIESISLDDVAGIYLGTITKWSEIAPGAMTGTSDTIVVIGRDSASGTRSYFDEEILKKQTPAPAMLEKNSNGAVLQTVAQTPGSIGYVSIGFVSNDVKALPIRYSDDKVVAPTLANVKSREYPISRNLYVITNGNPQGLSADFIAYLLSPAGQKIALDEGYVTIG